MQRKIPKNVNASAPLLSSLIRYCTMTQQLGRASYLPNKKYLRYIYILKAKIYIIYYNYYVLTVGHFSLDAIGVFFLVMHSLYKSKQITDEILLKLSETGVLELVKHCYCFNSKGDNFIVKKH